eukprot:402330_1
MGNVTSQMKSENRGKTRGANIQQVGNLGSSGGNAKHRQRQQQHQQQQFINDEHQGGVGGDTTSLGEGMVDVVGLSSPSCEESNVEGESNLAFHNACNFSDDPKSSPGLESSVTSSVFSGRFKKETDWSNQWKIFHALNVNDDKMMLDLSAFLSKLQQGYLSKSNNGLMNEDKHVDAFDLVEDEGAAPVRVPALVHGVDANSEDVFCMDEASLALDDEQWSTRQSLHATTLNLQDIELPQQEALCQLMRIGSTCVNFENIHVENLQDYNLEKESFTVATVHEVIHLYTAGGQLNIKSVRRILRKAYKTLKSLPNINTVDMDEETTVTVVGDLHGQLRDLLHLLSCNFPSTKNKYVFNGDFVDRGPDGVEILIILFMLMLALPGSVFLNRGNHEDFGLCCVYGFQKECLQKYNHVVFAMFGEMFCHIPICSVVANRLFVVHGGLFHRPGVTLDEITEIVRDKYAIPHSREFSDPYQMVVDIPSDRKNIMACALWSDPDLDLSSRTPEMNPRGAGILFGPDLTEDFLTTNNLAMVVRSHECVEEGYDLPFEGDMEYTCATIFSASNYGGSMNRGAVMKFSYLRRSGSKIAGGSKFGISNEYPVIYYRVHCWLSCDENDDKAFVERANKNGLSSLVLRRKRFLLEAFRQLDKTDSGHVSLEKWAMVMESVIGLDINWLSLIDIIVDKNDKHVCDADDEDKGECIDYTSFLSKFHAQYQMKAMNTQNIQLFDAVYNKRELLDGIFRFFDQDNDGIITRHEFNKGCELINEELPPKDRLTNTDAILDVMDLTSDGCICINEFFEVFRLVDCYNVEDDC